MDPTNTRTVGTTGATVTELGFGGASIGELFVRVSEHDALATIDLAWDAGVRYFDTAPWYGRGLSELRTGGGLRDHARRSAASGRARATQPSAPARPACCGGPDHAKKCRSASCTTARPCRPWSGW